MPLILILLLAVFQCSITNYLIANPDYYQLGPYSWESDDFRAMSLGDAVAGLDNLDPDMVATLMVEHDYDLTGINETVLGDLEYFPIPESRNKDTPEVAFENGWMDGRGYVSGGENGGGDNSRENGGRKNSPKRRHEGCDIMGSKMPPGYYPVVSMTDGIIEKIGWLEMGGWRIGVRAPGGAYLYYAHLYSYAGDFKEGDRVKAGELIGYMGDTGYGKTEGTRGNFDVHLHVGIYIKTDHNEEMSVNPYWILKWLEKKRLVFTY